MLKRLFDQCVVRPEDVKPSHDELKIVGTFNPGATLYREQTLLMVRIAEQPVETRQGQVALPRWEPETGLTIDWLSDDDVRFIDPRVVEIKTTGELRLTFISHLRVFRSSDGRSIDEQTSAALTPTTPYEVFGVEDPRITFLEDRYWITYVAASPYGALTCLASTTDWQQFERHGIIFCPENKDVVLFPEKIDGSYLALHRPNPATHFSPPQMWLARSPDLLDWGKHEFFHGGDQQWEAGRIGAGVPPFRGSRGWIEIYHGNNKSKQDKGIGAYFGAALLMDADDPRKIIARSDGPILLPERDFEKEGFVPNVVFPTGMAQRDDILQIYYGAADAFTGVVEIALSDLEASLR